LKAIEHLDNEIYDFVISRCLPYDKSLHVLPIEEVEAVEERLQKYLVQRAELIDVAVERYPDLLEQSRGPLGPLFNRRDYPSQSEFRRRFRLTWNYVSLSTPGKLKMISPALFQEERQKIQQKMQESLEEWQSLLSVGMMEVVKRLRDSLVPGPDGKTRKLTDASVDRLKEFLETLDAKAKVAFGSAQDYEELEQIGGTLKGLMAGVTVEQLRESETMKQQIGSVLADATKTLEVMTAGIRKFREDEE
jgi:hypothetical protein